MGIGKALEMMYTGKTVSAEEAYSLGLVNQVVPADNLMKITIDLAEKIAEAAPLALKSTKQTVWQALNCTLEQQITIETKVQNNLFKTEDFREGVAAFHEKRPPIFRGL
jgi:enoyl-CoA hydratase/carnithine racemase